MLQDLSSRIINAVMTGDITAEQGETLLDVHMRVTQSSTFTCPITGELLDSRTSHLLEVRPSPEHDSVMVVVSPRADDDTINARLHENLGEDVTFTRTDPAPIWKEIN